MKYKNSKPAVLLLVSAISMMSGCRQDEPPRDESVKEGEARSVFARNHSGAPMVFQVRINGLPFEEIVLQDGQSIIYYDPLPVGLERDLVEKYKIQGKITDNFGRSRSATGIEFSLDMGPSEAYPYHPNGWSSSSLHPGYHFNEPLDDWLTEINATARKIDNLREIEIIAKPSKENEDAEPTAGENASRPTA